MERAKNFVDANKNYKIYNELPLPNQKPSELVYGKSPRSARGNNKEINLPYD